MMRYILDTNILLLHVRKNPLWFQLEERYNFPSKDVTTIISVVTVGEIKALAKKNNWGSRKMRRLEKFLTGFLVLGINNEPTIQKYAEIDAFSQGKLKNRSLNTSARNMGKNDLWIAATASIADADLITLDKDFNHLHNEFLTLIQVDLE